MKPSVYILASVRHPSMLNAALLIFKTLRLGFPTVDIYVHGNALRDPALKAVQQAAQGVGAFFVNQPVTVHDVWIEQLMERATEPFWICDTDVVFLNNVESLTGELLAGRLEPEWYCDWTDAVHVERLHTCLLYFNPGNIRSVMRAWVAKFPPPWVDTVEYTLIRQTLGRRAGKNILYDTCAGLYQVVGGRAFTDEENERFEHLSAATYVDCVDSPSMNGLSTVHRAVYDDVRCASGLWQAQTNYYRAHQPVL